MTAAYVDAVVKTDVADLVEADIPMLIATSTLINAHFTAAAFLVSPRVFTNDNHLASTTRPISIARERSKSERCNSQGKIGHSSWLSSECR